ncbi:MAG: twin-arginine translocation signal domain-containing protein [Verrucomicrobiota bacterium]
MHIKSDPLITGCAACPMNRRNFLTRAGTAAAGALGGLATPAWLGAAESGEKSRIRVVYALHGEKQAGPDWPNKGFDFRPVMDRINTTLARECKGFEFIPSLATGADQAKQLLEGDKAAGNIDGYLVYQMNCWNAVAQTLATSGKPVLYADFQFGGSGGFLVYNAAFLRHQAANIGFVASSNMKDLVEAVKCFRVVKSGGTVADFVAATARVRLKGTPGAGRLAGKADPVKCLSGDECLRRLKETKLLAVRDQNSGPASEVMGVKVEQIPFAELNEAWQQADKEETRAVADQWTKSARKIEGVTRETLEASAAMYLAEQALLKKHGANGITINCLGGFYGGHIHAYPCLGFYQLNSDGLIGGCECDVRSAATMVIGTTLTQGRPGYISDPVIDTSKRQIIYAHCVSHNKAFGPAGEANPFEILTHSEDRQGASIRSLLPTGYLTTSLEFDQGRKEILFHRALAVANDPDDRACRTKLCAEPVGDLEKLFRMWDQWSWHRVTFYGDLKEPVYALAEAAGWKVVEEA